MRLDEQQRIKASDGFILRGKVQGELAISRAIGNIEHKSVVFPEPETMQHFLTNMDDLLILSTDGLYRSFTIEHVANRVV